MILLALLLVITKAHARGFNVTHLLVPEEVYENQTEVIFECRYEGNFTILEWFKGPNEFFRYKPGAAPSTRSFPILGVGTIKMMYCGPTECCLHLGELTDEATGLYRCDIERAVVPYKYATKSAHMLVHGRKYRQPLLEGVAPEFGEGDQIKAYCRAEENIEVRWYINEREVRQMRGSKAFHRKSSRFDFAGMPPVLTLKCAEFVKGKLYGSKEAKALWKDPFRTYTHGTAQEQKNSGNNLTFNFIIGASIVFCKMFYLFVNNLNIKIKQNFI